MSSTNDPPQVRMHTEGRVCIITVDNRSKKNAYTPAMMDQLAEHLTAY